MRWRSAAEVIAIPVIAVGVLCIPVAIVLWGLWAGHLARECGLFP